MPYRTNSALPDAVKNALPSAAQSIFRNTFNSAEERGLSEERAFRMGWGAVRNAGYRKPAGEGGKWVKKAADVPPDLVDFYILEKNQKQRYTLGIVYEPDEIDTQDDFASAQTIEHAAWDFMCKLQTMDLSVQRAEQLISGLQKAMDGDEVRLDITDWADDISKGRVGDMHSVWPDELGTVVESYIAPVDFEIGGEPVKKGSWLLGVVWSEEHYDKIESGERTGYSLGGKAMRV